MSHKSIIGFHTLSGYLLVGLMSALMIVQESSGGASRPPTSCLDENGKPIDWMISYKLPVVRKAHKELFKSGWAYATISSNSVSASRSDGKRRRTSSPVEEGWQLSQLPINDHDSLIMKILEPIHDTKHVQGLSTVFYNDQPPGMNPPSPRLAHAKGVLAMDETTNTGFWLTHSAPRFPQPHDQKLEMSANSRRFGQSFMCISFKLNESGRQIVNHLINMSPMVYEADISESLIAAFPRVALLEKEHLRRNIYECTPRLQQTIKMSNGKEVKLFSKSGQDNSDMFEWLNDALGSSLYVESWRNGVGKLHSTCPRHYYHVNNVQMLHMSTPEEDVEWRSGKDHSKWAITQEEEGGVVCLSDVNRMESQMKRGGGAVCMECASCWKSFRSSISNVEPCDAVTGKSIGAEEPWNGEDEEELAFGEEDYESV